MSSLDDHEIYYVILHFTTPNKDNTPGHILTLLKIHKKYGRSEQRYIELYKNSLDLLS